MINTCNKNIESQEKKLFNSSLKEKVKDKKWKENKTDLRPVEHILERRGLKGGPAVWIVSTCSAFSEKFGSKVYEWRNKS